MKNLLKAVFLRFLPVVLCVDFISGNSVSTAAVFSQPLDSGSVECLGCHDPSITSTMGASSVKICPLPACNHPVGVDYGASAAGNQNFKPLPLNPPIPLYGSNLGCGTCHAPYSSNDHRYLAQVRKDPAVPDPLLIMDNRLGELCVVCHIMK